MSATFDRRVLSGIEGIEGVWAEGPEWFSYSSVTEAEDCPRRWGLRRAAYADLWPGNGYPDRPNIAALAGEVAHRSLETIIGALADNGCTSPQDSDAVMVMRSLGGYSAVIRDAVREQMRRLEDNPRCRGQIDHITRELEQRSAQLRTDTQALVSRSNFAPRPHRTKAPAGPKSGATALQHLPDGSYTEMTLTSSELGMTGRADLVTLTGSDVHIVDYKTGEPSTDHADQLRMYALLWSRSDRPDPARPYATRLSVSYPTCDIEVEVPAAAELDALEARTVARLEHLVSQLSENPPEARPDEQRCRYCPVRHLCDPYWNSPAFTAADEGIGDSRGEVVEVTGPKTWTIRSSSGEDMLLLGSDTSAEFAPGSWLRILDAHVSPAADTDSAVVSLVSASEVHVERRASGP
ncbi:PD-(D/E)XK nuclease family protein [Candidatus Poriferisodalis sp.]|uniref:PD-(D/E)XK nuclease family protein n=1 Tax=Candidatus Poriferisodalis sp. TaxID=3101277 RepID=UPI003B518EDC